MERLLADAEKISGVHYDISNLNDVYSAIHVIQEEMGVTGTTAQEAEKTISGSVNSMKAAFDNFLNGSGSPEALAESIGNVLKNIGDAVTKLAPGILNGIVQLVVDDWDAYNWCNGLTDQWLPVFTIPQGYRTTLSADNDVERIHFSNVFNGFIRMRINIKTQKIECNVSSSADPKQKFYSSVIWFTTDY